MKKCICLLLACWLPLFMSAASAASLQMAFASQANLPHEATADMAKMPCHQSLNQHTDQSTPKKSSHTCMACGFCVVASSFAYFSHEILIESFAPTSVQPSFFSAVFHSQTYPPAIKPPIFLV